MCVALVARFILGLGLIPTHAYHLTIVVHHVHIMNVTFLCMCFLFYASSNFYAYCYLFCKCEIFIKMFSSCSNLCIFQLFLEKFEFFSWCSISIACSSFLWMFESFRFLSGRHVYGQVFYPCCNFYA